jgi:hypothetical protein
MEIGPLAATKADGLRYLSQAMSAAMPSSAIRNFVYDAATGDLWVTFVSGRRYVYADVTRDVFDAFRTAPSRGAFFNHHIRDHYAYREVTKRSGSDRR